MAAVIIFCIFQRRRHKARMKAEAASGQRWQTGYQARLMRENEVNQRRIAELPGSVVLTEMGADPLDRRRQESKKTVRINEKGIWM